MMVALKKSAGSSSKRLVTQGLITVVLETRCEAEGSPGLGGWSWKWAKTSVLWRLRQNILFYLYFEETVAQKHSLKSRKELQRVWHHFLQRLGQKLTLWSSLVNPGVFVAPERDKGYRTKRKSKSGIGLISWLQCVTFIYREQQDSPGAQEPGQIMR